MHAGYGGLAACYLLWHAANHNLVVKTEAGMEGGGGYGRAGVKLARRRVCVS